MIRHSIKLLLFVVVAPLAVSSALAQGWPFPAKTPNTPVKCPATAVPCAKGPDKLTAAYSDPIKTFTGRFLDSQSTKEWQNNPRRSLRARLSRIAPEFNRAVIFTTNDRTPHGFPEPLLCPQGETRKSLQLYYYTAGRPASEQSATHGTIFHPRPS